MRYSSAVVHATACFFLWLPTRIANAQMITAHRGASFDAPENTLAAFQLAWEQSADAIEGDFYLTMDDEIVCIHDGTTERTGAVKRSVEGSTLSELRSLNVGAWKHERFKNERIPLFAEVYATVPPGKRFVIELKSKGKIVPVLMKQLETLGAKPEQLLIISFDAKSIAECKRLRPDIRAHWLTGLKVSANGEAIPSAETIAKTVEACRADGVGMQGNVSAIDAAFVDTLLEKGCPEFHVWTVDDPQNALHFQSLGAVGITTNRPTLIRKALFAN